MVKKIACRCANRDYSRLLELFKTVADANRLRIICFLKRKEYCAGELAEALGLPQNLASHHLKALRSVGLLSSRRQGKYIYYRTNEKGLASFRSRIEEALGEC